MDCNETFCPKNIKSENSITPPPQLDFPQAQEKNLSSRKFIAFTLTIILCLGVFLLVYLRSNDVHLMEKFLNTCLWLLIAYIGGNSAERLTDKLGNKE
jgi:hypothetical protein